MRDLNTKRVATLVSWDSIMRTKLSARNKLCYIQTKRFAYDRSAAVLNINTNIIR